MNCQMKQLLVFKLDSWQVEHLNILRKFFEEHQFVQFATTGLLLKNCMTSKDHAQAVKLANDWMGLDPQARTQIKACR
jgi:hypothetical protein